MKFTNPIDDERIYHFNKSLGQTNEGYLEKTDSVIRTQPRMAVSPVTGRIYGTFVDEDGILKAGLALVDDSDWESTWAVSLVPVSHTGKIRNPFIAIDAQGNVCIGYEYWPTEIAPEVWVYDERLIGIVVTPFIQKVTDGRCPVVLSDRDEDLLIFYKRSDGVLCWRARSAPPYITVWDTENTIVITGLSGELYIDDAFVVGGTELWESAAIVLCISKRIKGRYGLYYVRSSNWPKSITNSEFLYIDSAISDISWITILEYIIDEVLTPELYLSMIGWIVNNEYDTFDTLLVMSQISQITWAGGDVYTISEPVLYIEGEISVITWTSNNNVNSPDEDLVCTSQITVISLTSV